MTYLELYRRFRVQMDDTGGDTGLPSQGYTYYWEQDDSGCRWSNQDLIDYLEQTLYELSARRVYKDRKTFTATLKAQADYSIDESVSMIYGVRYKNAAGSYRRLVKASVEWLDANCTNWRTAPGEPFYYLHSPYERTITLAPIPTATQATGGALLEIEVGRMWSELVTWDTRASEIPDFELQWVQAVLAGMQMFAFDKRDTKTYMPEAAGRAEDKFKKLVGPRRSLENLEARRINADRHPLTTGTARPY